MTLVIYCCYCEEVIKTVSDKTMEHLVPLSKGGNSSHLNKRPCCKRCNQQRGNKNYYDWIAELTKRINAIPTPTAKRQRLDTMVLNIKRLKRYTEANMEKLMRKKSVNKKKSFIKTVWDRKAEFISGRLNNNY